jgi:regulator of replication initiation timing
MHYEYYNQRYKKKLFNEIIHISNSLGVLYRKLGELKKALNILLVFNRIYLKYINLSNSTVI